MPKQAMPLALKGEDVLMPMILCKCCGTRLSGCCVERPIEQLDIAQLVVADTRLALGHLGQFRRQQFPQLNVLA